MAERETKRNARRSKNRNDFRICSEPLVRVPGRARSPDVGGSMALPLFYDRPILFAVARDEGTIFVSWNINWRCVFEKAMPRDRQVHLRVIGSDGLQQKSVTVEPMAGMHYLTTPLPNDSLRVEIGYFQAFDAWHSVAISEEVKMPLPASAEISDLDLATIPFHLSFEELANSFGSPDDAPLTRAMSKLQKRILTTHEPNELSPAETQFVRKLNLRLPEIAATQRDFENSNMQKLALRSGALLGSRATSPSRGFQIAFGL